jgi:hypothetical protein
MEAEDKALELVNRFRPMMYCYSGSGMLTDSVEDSVILQNAKNCAIVVVDNILAYINHQLPFSHSDGYKYWTDVKQAILQIKL